MPNIMKILRLLLLGFNYYGVNWGVNLHFLCQQVIICLYATLIKYNLILK